MSGAHTPGPWSCRKTPESSYGDFAVQIGKSYINVDGEANARLIAAAPDLLAALELAYRHLNGGGDALTGVEFDAAFKKARAAIAKATGSAA